MKLAIRHLNFKYAAKAPLLFKDFNLSLEEGKILSVLGNSGCGKSTLLRIIAGLEEGSEGLIQIGDRVMQDQDRFIPVEKRNIGFVFQDYALFPFMTVERNIRFGMKKPCRKKLQELLRLTHLEGLEKRYPHELSGGQQQRVALARTLASEPSLLLLDEPFSNLDSNLVDDLRKDLKEIIRKQNITTVFVTHNVEDARYLADEVVEFTA